MMKLDVGTTIILALGGMCALLATAVAGTRSAPAVAGGAPFAAQQPQAGQWQVITSPNVGTGSNSLHSVAGNAANDVVAVGSYTDASSNQHTLIEHWDGSAWSVVPSQDPDPTINRLNAVASDQAGGYWAVGISFNQMYGALVERQTSPGAPWSLVPVPSLNYPALNAVSVLSANDAWAVGNYAGPSFYEQTLVLHWNGSTWSQVVSPNLNTGDNYLTGVAAVDANNIWAVGYSPQTSGTVALTLHCDDTLTCTSVPFPNPSNHTLLNAVGGRPGAGGGVELWASGYYADSTSGHALVAYGDGQGWSLDSPNQQYVLNGIYVPTGTVHGLGGRPVIAVGDDETPGHTQIMPSAVTSDTTQPAWTVQPPVAVLTGTNLFFGLGGAPSATAEGGSPAQPFDILWAVGYTNVPTTGVTMPQGGGGCCDSTLIERWQQTNPLPTPTATPIPTATPLCVDHDTHAVSNGGFETGSLAPWIGFLSNTQWQVAATYPHSGQYGAVVHFDATHNWAELMQEGITLPAGPSTLHFAVNVGPNVRLAVSLRGDEDGAVMYMTAAATGDWREVVVPLPERLQGQRNVLLTIVATRIQHDNSEVSAQLDDVSIWTVGCPTPTPPPCLRADCVPGFSDVPAGSPFYPFVTDLTRLGAISGYADGTFRPGNPVTRGQLAKIAWLASGALAVLDPTQQTFADVPPGSPFWAVVEPLAGLSLISGYTCGGLGEPCDAQQRPYYRPNTPVTRAQVAKIVDGAGGLVLRHPPTPSFGDVLPTNPFYPYVETAACYGVLSGYADHTFRPGNPATRGQTSKIVDNGVVQPLTACTEPTATR